MDDLGGLGQGAAAGLPNASTFPQVSVLAANDVVSHRARLCVEPGDGAPLSQIDDLRDRVMSPAVGPEPVGDRHEVGLEDGFQDRLECCLHDPVLDGGDRD